MGRKRPPKDVEPYTADEWSDEPPPPDPGRGRTARKREVNALHDVAVELAGLSAENLAMVPMSDEVAAAVVEARRLGGKKSHRVGKKRQLLYLAGVLRREEDEDLAALRDALGSSPKNSPRELALQSAERWRTRILKDDGFSEIEKLLEEYPRGDRQRLRALARSARKGDREDKVKRARKELFKAIREAIGV
ncbi:MAG: DUF615 domain-containing protein [Proteobacteria bacterium]|nr:DUF615 domain-containing protein [Pseudomonadota bacterium]